MIYYLLTIFSSTKTIINRNLDTSCFSPSRNHTLLLALTFSSDQVLIQNYIIFPPILIDGYVDVCNSCQRILELSKNLKINIQAGLMLFFFFFVGIQARLQNASDTTLAALEYLKKDRRTVFSFSFLKPMSCKSLT